MRSLFQRFFLVLVIGAFSAAAHADRALEGKWRLVNGKSDDAVGTLSANKKFFTIALDEPDVNFTVGYTQAPSGVFRCTVIDKQVIVMEGRFKNDRSFNMDITVKEIGQPATESWSVVAIRDE